jgi:hypothetical protein
VLFHKSDVLEPRKPKLRRFADRCQCGSVTPFWALRESAFPHPDPRDGNTSLNIRCEKKACGKRLCLSCASRLPLDAGKVGTGHHSGDASCEFVARGRSQS